MSRGYYSHQSPYVEHRHSSVSAPTSPPPPPQTPSVTHRHQPQSFSQYHADHSHDFLPCWPTPSSQSRLTTTTRTTTRTTRRKKTQEIDQPRAVELDSCAPTNLAPRTSHSSQHKRAQGSTTSTTSNTLSKLNSFSFGNTSDTIQTPPLSATSSHFTNFQPSPVIMNQQRRLSSNGQVQRSLMGPPETPSRGMIPQSPGLFSNINFSPDLFSHHHHQPLDTQTAPVLPQHRLFWDPATATPLPDTPQNFQTPSAYPDDFIYSFNMEPGTLPREFVTPPQTMSYDLPSVPNTIDQSFLDAAPLFHAPFHTSPRLVPPHIENPTQFLSSPARRFGTDQNDLPNPGPSMPDLPAYHHQIEESKRERELMARQLRKRARTSRRSQVPDQDLVMKSVRRALSPSKSNQRPSLTRSATYAGVPSSARRSISGLDNISLSSASSHSTRNGRSSPIRRMRNTSRRSSAHQLISRNSSRASLSLAIDENGVACTTMNPLPEHDESEQSDDDMTDELPSDDDQILYSFADPPDFFDTRNDRSSTVRLSLGSDKVARISNLPPTPSESRFDPQSTIRRVRGETLTSALPKSSETAGNAQQALRALVLDRSHSTSSHASSSSMQFPSSPPLPQAQFGPYQASPATVTDPDLNTPSTDAGSSQTSHDTTRCVCNSSSPDGNIMIQCDSCTKWLHAKCVGLTNRNIPDIYICTFCEQTPVRGGTIRANARHSSFRQSPLAHKSRRR